MSMSELGQVTAPSVRTSGPKSDEHMPVCRAHQASESEGSTAQFAKFESESLPWFECVVFTSKDATTWLSMMIVLV